MIYISSSAINTSSIEEAVNKLAGMGLRHIELSGGTKYSDNIRKKLKELKEEFSLKFLIHNYFPPPREDFILNIASQNKETRQKSIQFIKESIDLASNLNIGFYTSHPGYTTEFRAAEKSDYFIADSSSRISSEHARINMFESLSEVRDYAAMHGIRIGLENLFPPNDAPESSLLCTPDELFHFLGHFEDDSYVGLLLDLGHLSISANYYDFDKGEFTETLRKNFSHKIFEIHLSENDGKNDQHALLERDGWQLRTARRFDSEKIPITIECRGINTHEISNQYQMVKNIFRMKN